MKLADFKKLLSKEFASGMKKLNYNKITDLSWNKRGPNPYIFSIQVFLDERTKGKYCWIEAGIHLDFIPSEIDNKKPDPEKIEAISCMFRERLTNTLNDDTDFIFGNEKEGMDIICDYLYWAVRDEAEELFSSFNNFPEPFNSITVEDIKNRKPYGNFRFGGDMHEALQFARINLYIGEKEKANQFADYGLSLITGIRGSGLIPKFQKIKEGELYF